MPKNTISDLPRAAGYTSLVERYGLQVIPHWHRSAVSTRTTHKIQVAEGQTEETFPAKYWPGESLGEHLEFALKYDGTNLGILSSIFEAASPDELLCHIRSKPTGSYARRLWFLYELLTGKRLGLSDLKQGNYADLLDPEEYYTIPSPRRVSRQRINDNLLGGRDLCPLLRRTPTLRRFEKIDFSRRCRKILTDYSRDLRKRALNYLYTKETKSSFEIEHVKPDATRTQRFMAALQLAEREDFCEKSRLVELHNRVVDPRFRASDYRTSQNYVGETITWQREKIHFAGPKPQDVESLMRGLIASHLRMQGGSVSPVAHAATIAYGFVFIHPFEDGNGRIHRFLIHNILSRRGFVPRGLMFPVSAAMLKDPVGYDSSLEAFSIPLMPLIDYELDEDGRMNVRNDTSRWYRYPDLTTQTEALFRFIERTVDVELAEELSYLAKYDEAKERLGEIVDLPDRKVDLFIRFCLQSRGRLSMRRRSSLYGFLSDLEIAKMEKVVKRVYGL